MTRVLLILLLAFVLLGVFAWANDKVTSQGERTVYTVDCVDGNWQEEHCTGRLVAGKRYRFRALKAHREVLFWTMGDRGRSGRFTECEVVDGQNWTCDPNDEVARTIAHQMEHGKPLLDPKVTMIAYHSIAKWKWVLLDVGIPVGSDAGT